MGDKIRVGITHGDINGIGPEVIVKAIGDDRMLELMTPIVYSSPKIMSYYRKALPSLPQIQFKTITDATDAVDGTYSLVAVDMPEDIKIEPGIPSKAAGKAAFDALERAVSDLRQGSIDALVTAPIAKDSIQSPTFTFPGHTEYLEASLAEPSRDQALMMMCSGDLRVALVTSHTPLSKVAEAITVENIVSKLKILNRSLTEDFSITTPRIAVLALNPHSGENGLLGSEENEIIIPALEEARSEGILCFGPYAADGFFGSGAWKSFDATLAMYHDQGLAPFKTMAMDGGVNFTAGLTQVRTSPDHGTAFDIAATGKANPESMHSALYLAVDIVRSRRRHEESNSNPLRKQSAEKQKKGRQPMAAQFSPDQKETKEERAEE